MQEDRIKKWKYRWSPTLGALEDTAEKIWGIEAYFGDDRDNPAVFFGIYGLPDFFWLWKHKGRKCILWAGTDIIHLKKGYWLEDGGGIRMSHRPFSTWINKYCENYVENEVEQKALAEMGIESKVVPSFLGDVKDFPLVYKKEEKVRLYTSVSGDNFEQYGWDKILDIATENPDIEFHLYGNIKIPSDLLYAAALKNRFKASIFIHGRVPKEQMNREIKDMSGPLRLTEFDGFSEIIAKGLLWAQWPVSLIEYPHTINLKFTKEKWPDGEKTVKPHLYKFDKKIMIPSEPNIQGREWFLSVVNKYPWNQKQ